LLSSFIIITGANLIAGGWLHFVFVDKNFQTDVKKTDNIHYICELFARQVNICIFAELVVNKGVLTN